MAESSHRCAQHSKSEAQICHAAREVSSSRIGNQQTSQQWAGVSHDQPSEQSACAGLQSHTSAEMHARHCCTDSMPVDVHPAWLVQAAGYAIGSPGHSRHTSSLQGLR